MTTLTAHAHDHGKRRPATTVTVYRDGVKTDSTTSETMRYVEVLVSLPAGKVVARSQKRGGTPNPVAGRTARVPVTPKQEENDMTPSTDSPAPVALKTAPSGKVTQWGVQGISGVSFKTRSAAQAWIDEAEALNGPGEDQSPIDVAAERRSAEYAKALADPDGARRDAHQAEREAAPAPAPEPKKGTVVTPATPKVEIPLETLLPDKAVTDAPKSGSYIRVKVGGKSIGYVSPRKGGAQLVEILTSRLKDATPALLEGTRDRQNQTALLVTDETTATQARALFTLAAGTVQS